MLKKLLLFVGLITFSFSCFAQILTRLEGDDAQSMYSLSRNGRFASGYAEGAGAWYYDLALKKMTNLVPYDNQDGEISDYMISGFSDNEISVGMERVTFYEGEAVLGQAEYPAYFKNKECKRLPLPGGNVNINGMALAVTEDGSMIVGVVNPLGGFDRKPCIWTLQTDGTYKIEMLPTFEKDLTGRTPQGIDPVRCSAKGDVIVGRMVDYSSFYGYYLTWTKNDQNVWEIKEFGKDLVYKPGVTLPVIPEDPESVNAKDFFTAEELAAYNKAVEDYLNDPVGDDPSIYPENYLTNPDSKAKYDALLAKNQEISDIIYGKLIELQSCLTGKALDVFSVSMSANGNYLGTTCFSDGGGGGLEPNILSSPIKFDLKTGAYDVKTYIEDGIVNGITDNGDIYFAAPYAEVTRTSFVIPTGTNNIIDVAEWVKQKTNGAIDMRPDFLFSYEYDNSGGVMMRDLVVVTDSLIVGDVIPSANGRVLLGTFFSPIGDGTITYYVDMDGVLTDIENVAGDATISVYPNPATDVLYIKGNAESVSVVDLTGRTVYESVSVSNSIPVGSFGAGTYLVKIKADGKVTTHKVFVK